MSLSTSAHFFTEALMNWYEPERRPLPWKHIDDPYLIWLSEIILQQTRAEQGMPYFQKFKERYPSVGDLASAPEDEVMKMWEGLGYYSRARNLHAAAKHIHEVHGGQFPEQYDDIRKLKGVGPYTAAAIASFGFNLPYAVVDGNVYRLLSRYFDEPLAIDINEGKKHFSQLADQLLDRGQPGLYNQAIMDMGATVCTPKAPSCELCPLQEKCQAYANDTISVRPVKVKKLKRRTRYFNYLVLQHTDFSVLEKRTKKDIWRNLYQFPLIEATAAVEDLDELKKQAQWPRWLKEGHFSLKRKIGPQKQELTHQRIVAVFWELACTDLAAEHLPDDFVIVKPENCRKFAFPKIISWYFDDNSLYLF